MRNLLVTGGAGFIGSNLVRYLLRKYSDYRIVVYDKLTYAGNLDNLRDVAADPRYAFVRGDICDPAAVENAIREHHIDTIVNLAAETHVDRSIMDADAFIRTDVYGTYVLLEAAKKFGLERVHQVGSVTGDTPLLVRDDRTGEIALEPIAELDAEAIDQYSVLTLGADYRVDFHRIKHFIQHTADELYEITYNGGGKIRATANHSVFVFEGGQIVAKPSSDLQVGDLMVTFLGEVSPDERHAHTFDLQTTLAGYRYAGMESSIGVRQAILESLASQPARYSQLQGAIQDASGGSRFRIVEELARDGYLDRSNGVYRVTAQTLTDASEQARRAWWDLTKRKLHVPYDSLPVSTELMEVFGLYLAEGHCSHTEAEMAAAERSVVFTIGKDEQEQLAKLKRCATDILRIQPYVRERESSYQIKYASRWVHAIFSQFGPTAETKRLPGWVWTSPKDHVQALFRGYEGDAAVKKDGRRYHTSVSRTLIENLLWLARMNDINSLYSKRTVKQVKGQIPPGITVTRDREFHDLQITAESTRRGEAGPWRTPMARCIPTAAVAQPLGGKYHQGKVLSEKPKVGKLKAAMFCRTLDPKTVPAQVQMLLESEIGIAQVKAIRKEQGTFTVYDVSVPGNEKFFGGNVPCLLHNTDEVYGWIEEGSSTEEDRLLPRSPYAASKAGADLLIYAYYVTHQVPVTVSRGANNIGPYQYPEKVVPLFITNAMDNLPLPLYGDGRQQRDYQYVLDHCEGIDLVLHRGKLGESYNIGTGRETYNIDMAHLILKLLDKPASLIQHVKDRPGHDRRYSLDVTKLRALGWEPAHTFESALEATVKWYVANEWWWRKLKSGEYMEYYKKQYVTR